MAFCTQCGSAVPDGARFCPKCGTAVASATPPALDTHAAAPAIFDAVPPPAASQTYPEPQSHAPAAAPSTAGGGPAWILPVVVILALLALAYVFIVRRGDGPAVDAGTPIATRGGGETAGGAGSVATSGRTAVSAATLDSAFNADPNAATLRYPGPLTVTGVIASTEQPGSSPSLSLEGRTRFNYMIATFSDGGRARLAPLTKGQTVTTRCDGVRTLGGTTILSGCRLP